MMKKNKRLGAAIVALILILSSAMSGCEPEKPKMRLLAYDSANDSYGFDDVEVRTLDDIGRLKGEATSLVGGTSLKLDYEENLLTWKDVGNSVAFEWTEQDGVLIPEDYHSLAMASIYYNIELSMLFFSDELGLPEGTLNKMKTYYWVDLKVIETSGEDYKSKDNAFYMYMTPSEQAFFIVPFDEFQWVPMPLNSGIMTHEYSHAVFDALVYRLNGNAETDATSANFLTGINEGCADFFSVARTADSNYLSHSVPPGFFVINCNDPDKTVELVRDAARPMDYTKTMDDPARIMTTAEFCPYDIGAFFASLLYEIAGETGETIDGAPSRESLVMVAKWLLGAMAELGDVIASGSQTTFEVWYILSYFVAQIDNEDAKDNACSVIQRRYNMYFDRVGGCS